MVVLGSRRPGKGVVFLVTFVRYPSGDPCLGFPRYEPGVVNFMARNRFALGCSGMSLMASSFVPVVDCLFVCIGGS